MRNYTPKSCNLPRFVYRTVIETVRGYNEMKMKMSEVEDEVIHASSTFSNSGIKVNRAHSKPTEEKAIRIIKRNAEYERLINAVNEALAQFGHDVQTVILNNIVKDIPLKCNYTYERDRNLGRKKRAFITIVAENLNLI